MHDVTGSLLVSGAMAATGAGSERMCGILQHCIQCVCAALDRFRANIGIQMWGLSAVCNVAMLGASCLHLSDIADAEEARTKPERDAAAAAAAAALAALAAGAAVLATAAPKRMTMWDNKMPTRDHWNLQEAGVLPPHAGDENDNEGAGEAGGVESRPTKRPVQGGLDAQSAIALAKFAKDCSQTSMAEACAVHISAAVRQPARTTAADLNGS